MNRNHFTVWRFDALQRSAKSHWRHRLVAALLLALLCTLAPPAARAQEETPLYCAALTADDCALLAAAHEQMRTLHAVAAANHMDFTASNIPDAPFDAISFSLDQQTTQSLNSEAVAALLELRQLAQTEPQLLMTEPQRLLDFYAALLAGANFDSHMQLTVSEDVVRLIEQAAEEEGEPIPFPLPNQLAFSTRLVDGTLYVNLSHLADLLPGLTATGDVWLGVEFAPVFDLIFSAAMTDADISTMRSSDAELFAQIMAASSSSTGGPLATTLAALPFGAQALPFLKIERAENGAVDGHETARFRTTVDYAALLADPTVQELIAQLIRDPDFGDQEMDEFEMRQTLTIIQQFGPTVLDTLGLELVEQIDLASGHFLGSELKLNWDVAQLAPLLAVAGMPELSAVPQLPVIALNSTTSYRDHNVDLTIEPPATALIVATSELLDLIPPAELDFLNSEPAPLLPPAAADGDPFAEALAYLDAGDPLSALPLFDQAIALEPNNAEYYAERALAQYQLGDYDAAIFDYSMALEIDSQYSWVYAQRASAYNQLGAYEEALADYDAAIAFDDQNAEHYFNRALVYYSLGRLEEEIADYARTLELDSSYTTAYYYRALSYQELGELERALADYNRALELEPDNSGMLMDRGLLYLNLDETELALADFAQTIALAPDDATGYINRSYTHGLQGNYADALADADRAVELAPDNPIAWGNRGDANGKLGNYEQALADFAQTLELAPDYATAYLDRGKLYHELGQVAEAIVDLERYLELAPDGADAAEVEALLEEIK
ncbi:MAG: tetratricopeptide repeat protein [Caldilineaceae bacterium]